MTASAVTRKPRTSRAQGKSARLAASCTPAELELAHQYAARVDREVSRLLRVLSVGELLSRAERLRDGKNTLVEEITFLAERSAR